MGFSAIYCLSSLVNQNLVTGSDCLFTTSGGVVQTIPRLSLLNKPSQWQSKVCGFNLLADLWTSIHSFCSNIFPHIFSSNELYSARGRNVSYSGLTSSSAKSNTQLPDRIRNGHPKMSLAAFIPPQFTPKAGLTFPYSRHRRCLVSQSQPGC